ncbi:PAS-domain containing protein [Aliiroseovarius crassostreae]|uniref:PAS-domain containing protein n=1 Tax=Aliiroseovarius crassostreae TaxID=154981 RepID=UPI00220FBE4A|nr:PAS-domain containing protein [Aliiroseovarius crassostreae]UWQ04765.1 PAS-domain containing protein [Aliiroseovarius crassostreae]
MLNSLMAAAMVLTAFCVALAALYVLTLTTARRRKPLAQVANAERDTAIFLFDDQKVIDATERGWQLLESTERPGNATDWQQLTSLLHSYFPDLETRMSELAEFGEVDLAAKDADCRLRAQWCNGLARIEFVEEAHSKGVDYHRLHALSDEVACLRSTADNLPFLIWREDENRTITWANHHYLDLADTQFPSGNASSWPPRKLFDRPQPAEEIDPDQPRRIALADGQSGQRKWYELHETILGNETVVTALPVDRLVKAENSLSDFVATLTKTFAHLPIGLAVFDRKRQLALFNPALTDLVTLPIEFLVGKPTLFSFLDHLREKRMMPEPKDYKSWRQQMSELETDAVNGTYEETWSLPSGQTYRVTGRPHPEGAVAFMFEDITAEISLTRRFRTELEMGQSALDCIDDAIAVFAPGGTLAMSNTAYARLWGNDPETSLMDVTISDACMTWRHKSRPSDIWDRIQIAVSNHAKRETLDGTCHLLNGREVTCRVMPMVRGATMVRFTPSAKLPASPTRSRTLQQKHDTAPPSLTTPRSAV